MRNRRLISSGLGGAGLLGGLYVASQSEMGLSAYYFLTQDVWALMVAAAILILAALVAPRLSPAKGLVPSFARHTVAPLAVAAAVAGIAFLGTRFIFGSTPISYDEVQANFDAAVFLGGHLAAPVPEEWRTVLPALAPTFFLNIPGGGAWVSSYWPVHAAIRALAAATVGLDWASPLLALVSILATWRVARQLWPEHPETALVAAVLLATTPQVLVTAMTPYAMTAHLALNMLWLSLFLEDKKATHAAALIVGVLATGLHQVVFHALFVAPFWLLLVARGRWRLAAFYAGGYALIGLAWISYPEVVAWMNDPEADLANPIVAVLWRRWQGALDAGVTGHTDFVALGVFNLARLIAWANPVTIVLFAIALPQLRQRSGMEIALVGGVLLTLAAAMLILPYQGHGWGYRYLHGELGCMALTAAATWRRLAETAPRWRGFWVGGTALTMLALFPLEAAYAHRWAAPIRAALNLIETAPADLVLVDTDAFPFAQDLIRNRPDLSNRPLVMVLKRLDPPALARLCGVFSVAVFDREAGARTGMLGADGDAPTNGAPRIPLPEQCHAVPL